MSTPVYEQLFYNQHMSTSTAEVGELIRRRRRKLGLSQADLARAVDVTDVYISGIERGVRSLERWPWQRLEALRRALQWTPEEFAEATGIELPAGTSEPDVEPDKRLVFETTLVKEGGFTEEEARQIADMLFGDKPPSLVNSELMYKYNRFILDLARSEGGRS